MIDIHFMSHGKAARHTPHSQFQHTRPPVHQECSHSISLHRSPAQATGQDAVGPVPLHLPSLLPSQQQEAKGQTTEKQAKIPIYAPFESGLSLFSGLAPRMIPWIHPSLNFFGPVHPILVQTRPHLEHDCLYRPAQFSPLHLLWSVHQLLGRDTLMGHTGLAGQHPNDNIGYSDLGLEGRTQTDRHSNW